MIDEPKPGIPGDSEALMLVAKLRAYLAELYIEDGCRPMDKRQVGCISCRMVEIDEHLQILGYEIATAMEFEDYTDGVRKP